MECSYRPAGQSMNISTLRGQKPTLETFYFTFTSNTLTRLFPLKRNNSLHLSTKGKRKGSDKQAPLPPGKMVSPAPATDYDPGNAARSTKKENPTRGQSQIRFQ
jgi:hypothetical protein